MKRFKTKYIAALGITLMLGACNKQLDLKPYQQIEQSQAIKTATDVQITLVGAYNRAGLSDLYGGGVFVYADLLATQQITDFQGTFQGLTQMTKQAIPNTDGFVNSVWADGYAVINQANNVLANLKLVNAADAARTEGEAKFLRGLVYFDLVRLFGRSYNDGDPAVNLGVPIVLTPTTVVNSAAQVSRATVSQVYAQAISDLTTAESKLPAAASGDFFANKASAAAILARLYLQKGDYTKAAIEADNVIKTGVFQLNSDYSDEFPYPGQVHVDNTDEDVFALQVTNQQGTNAFNTYYASSDNAGRGDIIIKQEFLDSFEPDDTRIGMYNEDSGGTLYTNKFDNVYGNAHVVRLAELYLIRAEANFRLGTAKGDTPANDLNKIRERAGLPDNNTPTLANILAERVHELAFEGGFFLHDAKRTKAKVNGLDYSSPRLVFPIPLREINANPKLVQNPGY